MKQFSKMLLTITLLGAVSGVSAADVYSSSYFLGHVGDSVGNGTLEMAGRTHLPDQDSMYGVFSVQTGYSQNFDQKKTGSYMFQTGTKNANTLNVGPANDGANGTDIYSANFGLGGGFASVITANPKFQAETTDFRVFVGLDEWVDGLHFQANLPVVWTSWDMQLTETTPNPVAADFGANVWDAGGFASATTTVAEYLKGGVVTPAAGLMLPAGLQFGLVDGKQKMTKVGNVNVSLSYDFIQKDGCYLSVGVNGLFNGAGKSKAKYWFEPAIGTMGRQGVGAAINGGYEFWESQDDDAHFCAHFKAHVDHLFDATVRRSFDITGRGQGSRYLLVKESTQAVGGAAVNPTIQNAINITSVQAKVGIGVMYNLDFLLRYQNGGLNLDLGYQLWGHSKEKLSKFVSTIDSVYAFQNMEADAGRGANVIRNPNLSSPNVTLNGASDAAGALVDAAVATTAANTLNSTDQLIIDSGLQPSALTNSVFGNVGYGWDDNDWQPFVGGGAAGTFGMDNKAFSQWHVFVNGGLCF